MRKYLFHSTGLFTLVMLGFPFGLCAQSPQEIFDQRVAPIFAGHCLECHNATAFKGKLDLSQRKPAQKGGESGIAIVPKALRKSLLWERISNDEMPPKHPLSKEEKQTLKTWIETGANWGTDPIDPFRYTSRKRAGYDWWALQAISSKPPKILHESFGRNPIDAFILAGLKEKNLSPSSEASRRVLIRRLSFDFCGLPPTPLEVESFLSDQTPDAYERLVDRFLSSPRFGERWARHWLDLARFGESQGFERDKLRTNSWRYRDWVIDALNDDLPYDEFARRQLAGDVLFPKEAKAKIATGFLVAGAYDEVGQSQQSAAMKAVVRQDELEDVISVVGQTFLGLTINCARCHDHKFDPITQKEYYQFAAALAGVRHGQPKVASQEITTQSQSGAEGLSAAIRHLESEIQQIEQPIRKQILASRSTQKPEAVKRPKPIVDWEFNGDLKDSAGGLHGQAVGNARVQKGWLLLDGQSYVATKPLPQDLTEKTLEAWVTVFGLDQRGGGVIGVQTLDGKTFDAIVFGEREPKRWMAGSNFFARTQSFFGPAETEAQPKRVHIAMTYSKEGVITCYRNGQLYGKPYKSQGPVTFKAGQSQVVFGLRHSPAGRGKFFTGSIDRARLYDRALSAKEIATSAGALFQSVTPGEISDRLTPAEKQHLADIQFEMAQLRSQQIRYQEQSVYAVAPRQPSPTHLLARGNTTQPQDVVRANGIASLHTLKAEFGLTPDAPEADRRKHLARWITHPENPLFARAIVNRLWQHHFGTGLVPTPSDLGFNGARPSHPELLDFLAGELIRNHWSLKTVHRLIVTSATYRQSSRLEESKHQTDADNRLLWRKSPRRLEAEALRDAMLSVSGQLNEKMHGPGYQDFRTFTANSQFYVMLDPVGNAFNRRSLYRTWVRSGRSGFLDVFDCPDPSAKAPNRPVTTTPLQALSLLNNSFAMRMADQFANRVLSEVGTKTTRQIERIYELAYARTPNDQEQNAAVSFVQSHGLSAFCRVVLNSNEFLYVD